jgi:hypothetical protein
MRIWALWGVRKGFEDDSPELMVAWDTYSADGNFEGWEKECEEAKASWGDDLSAWRLIEHEVDEEFLKRAFEPMSEKARKATVIDHG